MEIVFTVFKAKLKLLKSERDKRTYIMNLEKNRSKKQL